MVHVLSELHRTLRPNGILLDVHPSPRPSRIEVWRDGVRMFAGEPDDRIDMARIRAGRRGLNVAVRNGLFRVEKRLWFDFPVVYTSVGVWLRRREERGSNSVVSDELLAGVRQAMEGPGAALAIVERVRAMRLVWRGDG